MNSTLSHSVKTTHNKNLNPRLGYAAAALLVLSACSPPEKDKDSSAINITQNIPAEIVHDDFCADLTSANFDTGVREKIQKIGQEIPEVLTLLSGLEALPNHTIQFFDRNGFLIYLRQQGITMQAAEQSIMDTGAMTYIPDKKTPADKEHICIYLSPHALANKQHFIRGIVNELLNAFMALRLPAELEVKQRAPDTSGGINISEKEMRGIGIEFAKEYISGLVSTLILEKHQKKDISCSLSQLRENLRKGIFWHTDEPNYAFDYFYEILRRHGFPVERNEELLKLYAFCMDTIWPDLSRNTQRLGQWLNIPVQP